MKILGWLKGPMPRWQGLFLFPGCVLLGMIIGQILISKGIVCLHW